MSGFRVIDRRGNDGAQCRTVEASCVCNLPAHPADEPHECDCGGSWRIDPDGGFHVVRLPRRALLVSAMFGGLW